MITSYYKISNILNQMVYIAKRLKFRKVLSVILSVYMFTMLMGFGFSSPVKATEGEIIDCQLHSNILDARCRCAPNQCRLSVVGSADLHNSGKEDNNSGLTTDGDWTCFPQNYELGSAKVKTPDGRVSENNYRNTGYGTDAADEELQRVVSPRLSFHVERTVDASGNYVYQSGAPCYTYLKTVDDNGNDLGESLQKIETVCRSDSFVVGKIRGYTTIDDDRKCFIDGGNVDKNRATLTNPDHEVVDVGYDCGFGLKDRSKYYVSFSTDHVFYTDEFNKNPSNQNIPIGATCRVTTDSRGRTSSYWFFDGYFDQTSGTVINSTGTCVDSDGVKETPILVSQDLFGREATGTNTAFGCLPNSVNGIVAFVVRLVVGLAGGVALLVIIINLITIIASSNDPEKIAEARKKLTSAVVTFIVLLLSLTILSLLGLKILDLGGSGGSLLKIFTGG
jgi:hypothetical protein